MAYKHPSPWAVGVSRERLDATEEREVGPASYQAGPCEPRKAKKSGSFASVVPRFTESRATEETSALFGAYKQGVGATIEKRLAEARAKQSRLQDDKERQREARERYHAMYPNIYSNVGGQAFVRPKLVVPTEDADATSGESAQNGQSATPVA
jgi:hypothetical protein